MTPHAALRIACLWSRFIVGVVSVFVGLLRTRVSLKRSVVDGIFLMVVEQLESRFTWVLKGVFLKVLCRFQHKFLEGEICGGIIGGRANAGWPAIHQCCVLFLWTLNVHLVHFSFMLMFVVLTLFSLCSEGLRAFVSFVLEIAWVVFTTCRDLLSASLFL